ncbi:helix-turn-helix domain-containing protein [Shewanella frigidimarina]|uniref:helix-turn-helix domain-containing protein n=1 Tax=Shewanella frigidimarina TaxID=56812 RepID=UPI003D795DCF
MTDKPSKTQTSFLRRILVAYLIDLGKNTVPQVMEVTGMPRRTAQDTIKALNELEIEVEQYNRGKYRIKNWGAVNRSWIKNNFTHVCSVLSYPYYEISECSEMSYEQVVHDQSFYCAAQSLELDLKLAVLSRKPNTEERSRNAKQLVEEKSRNESRIAALRYMYRTVGREDLEQLMFELTDLTIEERSTALSDPEGWKLALEQAGQPYEEPPYVAPQKELNQWRVKFLSAIQSK